MLKGELEAIESIRKRLRQPSRPEEVWIGDDAAVVCLTGTGTLLLALDEVVAGVHADLGLTSLADFGWKAMASCLSDIAAMGGLPDHALVGVAAPKGVDLDELYEGIGAAAEEFSCPVVGGDLSGAPGLVVTVAATGSCDGPPVLRSGARPGDQVWVTGPLGSSAAGLRLLRAGGGASAGGGGRGVEGGADTPWTHGAGGRIGTAVAARLASSHARPVPRIAEGTAARLAGATAMIDVSDGLSIDLEHLARSSEVGVDLDRVPVAEGAALQEALGGGEDFELLFCVPPGASVEAAFAGLRPPVRIGTCTAERGRVRLAGRDLPRAGWEHRW